MSWNVHVRRYAQEQSLDFKVVVVEGDSCLLGRGVAAKMGLIQKVETVKDTATSGPMKTKEVDISLRGEAMPHCENTLRRASFPLMDKCKKELMWMESEYIIEKVSKPMDCCASMAPVREWNGDIRICVDLKHLNKAVRREHYPLPTLEDITPELCGSTVLTSLDAAFGFWQVLLNKRSCELTTFITPLGDICSRGFPLA